jgi:HEAT repeat protein
MSWVPVSPWPPPAPTTPGSSPASAPPAAHRLSSTPVHGAVLAVGRVRLIAASALLTADPGDARAGAVVMEALSDPAVRVRKAALSLVESLGAGGAAFLEVLRSRGSLEEEELRDVLARLIERLENQPGSELQPGSGLCEPGVRTP